MLSDKACGVFLPSAKSETMHWSTFNNVDKSIREINNTALMMAVHVNLIFSLYLYAQIYV